MEELPKLHSPLRFPLFALYAKGENEDLLLFVVPKSTLDCHLKWMSSRCGTSRPSPYIIFTTRMF